MTAEMCRTPLWQWLRFEAELDDGHKLTRSLFDRLLGEEMDALGGHAASALDQAKRLFVELVLPAEPAEFPTQSAYLLPD